MTSILPRIGFVSTSSSEGSDGAGIGLGMRTDPYRDLIKRKELGRGEPNEDEADYG